MIQILHYVLKTCVTFQAAIIIKAVVKTVWTNKSLIDIIAAPEVSLSKSHYHSKRVRYVTNFSRLSKTSCLKIFIFIMVLDK